MAYHLILCLWDHRCQILLAIGHQIHLGNPTGSYGGLDDEDEKSSGVLVGYSEILEMVSQALGSTEVQTYSGLKVQVGYLELVPLVQIVLKVLHDPYLERSWYQVDLQPVLLPSPQWHGQLPDQGQGPMWDTMACTSQAKPNPQPFPQPTHQTPIPQGFQQPTPVPTLSWSPPAGQPNPTSVSNQLPSSQPTFPTSHLQPNVDLQPSQPCFSGPSIVVSWCPAPIQYPGSQPNPTPFQPVNHGPSHQTTQAEGTANSPALLAKELHLRVLHQLHQLLWSFRPWNNDLVQRWKNALNPWQLL